MNFQGQRGHFIHPVSEPAVMAGNGTIGLEILEDLPDVDAVITPYGGGGLSCGVASAVRALKPKTTKLFAAEVDTAAPLAPSLAAGQPSRSGLCAQFCGRYWRQGHSAGDLAASKPPCWMAPSSFRWSKSPQHCRLMLERNRVLAEGRWRRPRSRGPGRAGRRGQSGLCGIGGQY